MKTQWYEDNGIRGIDKNLISPSPAQIIRESPNPKWPWPWGAFSNPNTSIYFIWTLPRILAPTGRKNPALTHEIWIQMIQISEETSLAHIPDQPFGVIDGFNYLERHQGRSNKEKHREIYIIIFTKITNFTIVDRGIILYWVK